MSLLMMTSACSDICKLFGVLILRFSRHISGTGRPRRRPQTTKVGWLKNSCFLFDNGRFQGAVRSGFKGVKNAFSVALRPSRQELQKVEYWGKY
jgi:hypothetical protein